MVEVISPVLHKYCSPVPHPEVVALIINDSPLQAIVVLALKDTEHWLQPSATFKTEIQTDKRKYLKGFIFNSFFKIQRLNTSGAQALKKPGHFSFLIRR
jgi:hypothetical protein